MKNFGKVLVILVLLSIGITAIVHFVVTPYFREKFEKQIRASCVGCDLQLGDILIAPFYGHASVKDIRLKVGNAEETLYEAKVESIAFTISPKTLIFGNFNASSIRILKPVVTITEGDRSGKPSPESTEKPPTFTLQSTEIRGGVFHYFHISKGQKAGLTLTKINADIGKIEARGGEKTDETVAEITALLEKSGKVKLKIMALLFSPDPLKVGVDLRIDGLQLADMAPFFGPETGLNLIGDLKRAESTVRVEGTSMRATTKVQYENLNIAMKKTQDRSALSAFFGNVLQKIAIDPKNTDEKKVDQKETILTARKPRESIVSFILRGMKEGAIEIASNF